jgi:inner membrane protein
MASRAELRFGVSDPRGLGANPQVIVNGARLRLQPGGGSGGGRGFFAWIDASRLTSQPIAVRFQYELRGNSSLTYAPQAGETVWNVRSAWPHPSFGKSLISTGDAGQGNVVEKVRPAIPDDYVARDAGAPQVASINLIQPVDLYSQVNRATKYGFLFIGFTFLALLMFDVIGGVRVSAVEYLLMGAAIVLFFVLLLAFAEVIGFTFAYIVASAAIAGLNTAYSAAVLNSWRRAYFIGGLLVGLYAVLYVLLSLEAFSLLIGSLLLFAALAGVMYGTRRIDWSAPRQTAVE